MGRGEQHAHVPAFGMAEQGGVLGADRVHDGANVVHPLLERRQLIVGDVVGEAGAALVEQDQARERREPPEEARQLRLLPHELDVRDPAGNVDEIERPLAHDLVGDVDVAASGVARLGRRHPRTANRRHAVGTPFSSCSPRSSNSIPEPPTRSFTVEETSTSPPPASAATRAPVETAIPASLPSWSSHSPVWTPARISRPSPRIPSTSACAHRIARAGPSKLAKNPSPAVSFSSPRNRLSSRRTRAWWRSSRSRHAASPSSAARSVEPTMSVKRSVASTLSGTAGADSPATSRSTSSTISGGRKIA